MRWGREAASERQPESSNESYKKREKEKKKKPIYSYSYYNIIHKQLFA